MNDEFYCELCNAKIKEEDDYCPECGAIFVDNMYCSVHNENLAEGTCVICNKAFCLKCGYRFNKIFLCNEHEHYEIFENHARFRGSSDITMLNYFKSYLIQNNLHPVIYSLKENNIPLGGINISDFTTTKGDDGNKQNEHKLMLPFNEVLRAEEILIELETSN